MTAGMWTFSFYLGSFVGPTFGGILVQHTSFAFSSEMFSAVFVFLAAVDVVSILLCRIPGGGGGRDQARGEETTLIQRR